jgi:SAM-dependent methyltransferase
MSKYAEKATKWSERQYADPGAYLRHRADVVIGLGPALELGDEVLDLACGDGGFGEVLLARGLRYRGVDSTPEMVEEATHRLGERAAIEMGDLNDYEPPARVAAATLFRAVYYARDRATFFRRVAGYTEKKLVFDLNPRQYDVDEVRADLATAGFDRVALHPFFVPQTRALPMPIAALLRALEHSGVPARAALKLRFTYLVAAYRSRR